MAKEGSREQQLREMRERRLVAAAPVKTLRGGGESRPAGKRQRSTLGNEDARNTLIRGRADVEALGPAAGVAPGPRETKPKRGRPRLEDRDKTLAATKPWAKLGMSESSWYRRQAEKRK